MRTLTTFILGLLLVFLGCVVIIFHKDLDSFWDYFYILLGIVNIWFGFQKLYKSTD